MTFLAGITHEARELGYDILLVTAREGADGIRRVAGTGVCEALLLMEIDRHDERIPAVLESGLPFTTIGLPDELPGGSAVDLDFEAAGRMVVERCLERNCANLLLYGDMRRNRQRNDVSRFLLGVEETASETGLKVVLDSGSPSGIPERARATGSSRTAVFGLGQVPDVLFAAAADGDLEAEDRLYLALTDNDLTHTSPLLTQVPRLEPRREEISALAVRELVRLLHEPAAQPRVRLMDPRWAAASGAARNSTAP
jgi:DNA-binding LacI/PurR family transcriptional regulator